MSAFTKLKGDLLLTPPQCLQLAWQSCESKHTKG